MIENKEYHTVKVDIFYLGSLLYIIVVGARCFESSIKTDDYYKHIITRDNNQFFNSLTKI